MSDLHSPFIPASGEGITIECYAPDGVTPSPISALASGNDIQTAMLTGIPAGSGQTATLTFNGQATTPLTASAAPSTAGNYGLWTLTGLTPGVPVALATGLVGGSNNSTVNRYDVISNGVVLSAPGGVIVNQNNGTQDGPSVTDGGATFGIKNLGTFTPTGTTLQILVTDQSQTNKFVACEVLQATVGGVATYFPVSGSSFTFAGLFNVNNAGFDGGRVYLGNCNHAGPAYQFSASAVQSALLALSSIQSGGVSVAQSGNACVVTFVGPMAGTLQAAITSTDPAVAVAHTALGGNVPHCSLNGGSSTPMTNWFLIPGMPFATYFFGSPLLSTDSIALTIPSTWATTAGGSISPYSGTIPNHVGGTSLPTLLTGPRQMAVGFNCETDFPGAPIVTFSNLDRRLARPIPANAGSSGTILAWNAAGNPTVTTTAILTKVVVTGPAPNPLFSPALSRTLPTGKYTLIGTANSGPVSLVALSGLATNTTVSILSNTYDGVSGSFAMVINVGVTGGQAAPFLAYDFHGTALNDGSGHFGHNVDSLTLLTPDPSDPTGNTAWAGTIPKYHPAYAAIHANTPYLRMMDQLNTNNNYLFNASDLTTNTTVNAQVVSITAPTVASKFDPANWLVAEITCSAPHNIKPLLPITITNGSTVLTTSGSTVSYASQFGLAYPISATVFHFQAQSTQNHHYGTIASSAYSGTGGTATGSYGGLPPIQELVERCNLANGGAGAGAHINVPVCGQDDLIAALVAPFANASTGLMAGKKLIVEFGNECWNFSFQTNYATRALSYLGGAGSDSDYTYGYVSGAAHAHSVALAAWVAAGRSSSDFIALYATQATYLAVGTSIAQKVVAGGHRIDGFGGAVYFDNSPIIFSTSNFTTGQIAAYQATAATMTVGQGLDWYEQMAKFGGVVEYITAQTKAMLVAQGLPNVPLIHYEGGPDEMDPLMTTAWGISKSVAALYHPRMFGIWTYILDKMELAGSRLIQIFFDQGTPGHDNSGRQYAWGTWNSYLQAAGTGNWTTDAANISAPLGTPASEVGGAYRARNALYAGTLVGGSNGGSSLATTYAISASPNPGYAGYPVEFLVTPDGPYTGTITLAPGGVPIGGSSAPRVLTFSGSASPQGVAFTPAGNGVMTVAGTNNGGLADPATAMVTVGLATDRARGSGRGGWRGRHATA